MEDKKKGYEPIENYGVIGNLNTIALVSIKGSIDFFSFPRFDSPTLFASLLDAENGGYFSVRPLMPDSKNKQLYLPDTAILLTRFFSETGIAEITDYMPINNDHECSIIRSVRTVRGHVNYRMECAPRFNYARTRHKIIQNENEILIQPENKIQPSFRLMSNIPIDIMNGDCIAEFSLNESQTAFFVLEAIDGHHSYPHLQQYVDETYKATNAFWKNWNDQSHYKGRWREIINRSAITLKLLTSSRYGSMIAAATSSLPEKIGGIRNWDYRYTWIRDSAFTMYVFLKLGYIKEASDFFSWVEERCLKKELQLMYAIDGKTDLSEFELNHFEGYKASAPVRIGNQAFSQYQLDIYGELIDCIYLFNKDGGAISYEFWKEIVKQVEFVILHWKEADHSIWEIRNQRREFLYSRMMCWVAIDRAIKIAVDRSFPAPVTKWHNVRDEIFKDIYTNFWNKKKKAFVQHKGSTSLDASTLLMALKRIISPKEARWEQTLEAIDKELRLDVLIYRYRDSIENIDGMSRDEGTFTMCSFWYVECLAKSGQLERAVENFEKMLGYANHLGLYSEQIGTKGEHLGNFPQAFTHLSLISAAIQLNKLLDVKEKK